MKPKVPRNNKSGSKEPGGERGARAHASKPTFTRPSGGATRRYVASKPKTDSGVLHQPRTLKAPAADPARDRSETGGGRGESRQLAGNMVEVSGAERLPSPAAQAAESMERKLHNRVLVLGKNREPLMPCTPARARQLLKKGDAVIDRRFPFTIRLKGRTTGATQPVVVKIDPGAKTTGMAIVRIDNQNPNKHHVLFKAELTHRGEQIRDALTQRSSFRRARRGRKTRYRAPRFNNRGGNRRGWLPPSLRHRVESTTTWITRFRRFIPVAGSEMELVRFDTQALQDPEISGVEYQQGQLFGYEVREYLLEKWGRRCAYCDAKDTPLQIEHIVSRAKGGSNRVSNLTLACVRCNTDKGARDVRDFVNDEARLDRILSRAKTSLASTAAVNATRFALFAKLQATGLPVTTSTGARTKWNRTRLGLPKTHAIDAACVGNVDSLTGAGVAPLAIQAMGRGSRKRTRLTAYGFPRGYLSPAKAHFGFRTGDMVTANGPRGQKAGRHSGRVAVRASGFFNIQSHAGTVQGIAHRHCSLLQRADGYSYTS